MAVSSTWINLVCAIGMAKKTLCRLEGRGAGDDRGEGHTTARVRARANASRLEAGPRDSKVTLVSVLTFAASETAASSLAFAASAAFADSAASMRACDASPGVSASTRVDVS